MNDLRILNLIANASSATLKHILHDLQHPENLSITSREKETRLISQVEAAKRLGMSRASVWRLIKDGTLQAVNVRGKRRVSLAGLQAFAAGEVRQ